MAKQLKPFLSILLQGNIPRGKPDNTKNNLNNVERVVAVPEILCGVESNATKINVLQPLVCWHVGFESADLSC